MEEIHQGIFNKKTTFNLKSLSQKMLKGGRGPLVKYYLPHCYGLLHYFLSHRIIWLNLVQLFLSLSFRFIWIY